MRQQAESKAVFCLSTGVQPSEYLNLTRAERDAFITAVNKRNKR